MTMARVKICGITRPADGIAAAEAGADAIGLVFHPDSSRAVSVETAAAICEALPPFVTVVGLFVDAAPARIREVLAGCPLDLLQFHGEEAPEDCRGYGRRYLKALRVRPGVDVAAAARRYAPGSLLVDAHVPGQAGGTGTAFDWDLLPAEEAGDLVLAGGLDPDNVGEAVRRVRPGAVDVSSGVESAPGIKSAERMEAFIQGVRDAAV